jgi:beta-lactamase superfamily II metal-dependent hydrolase
VKLPALWLALAFASGIAVSSSAAKMPAFSRAHHVAVVHVAQGQNFDWDGTQGQIFWPSVDIASVEAPEPTNNDSVVLRIGDGAIHFLLAGDAEREVEKALTDGNEPLQSDFLKVPHHGSKTSSTERFLEAVNPRFAAISVGEDNIYGQPNSAALQRYSVRSVQFFRTDINGAITAVTDGQALAVCAFTPSVMH